MAYRLLRKDFVPVETRCAAGCRHLLSSGTAWIVTDGTSEGAYDPTCVVEVVGEEAYQYAWRLVPNLTTHDALESPTGGGAPGYGRSSGGIADEFSLRHGRAAAYLTLRIGRLAALPGIPSKVRGHGPLVELYAAHVRNHGLTSRQVDHVHNIEAVTRARPEHWLLCLDNLLDVYTAYHRLLRLRREATTNARRSWIETLTSGLLQYLHLTPSQIEAAGLTLRSGAFPLDRRPPPPRFDSPLRQTEAPSLHVKHSPCARPS